jgi:DNA-binding XRE family transcriptional regulator
MSTRTPETITAEIKAWDCRDVRKLRDLLSELRACRDENGDEIDPRAYGVDTANLPSAPIPDWVDTGYPVWAVDVNGYALVGELLDTVEHVISEEIRKARLRLGLTQAQLAPLLGYSDVARVSELERGVRQPGAAVLRLLRAYLDGYRSRDWPHRQHSLEPSCPPPPA